jgi:hypothetical protein
MHLLHLLQLKATSGMYDTQFSIRGDGLVTVANTLAVSGSASFSGSATISGVVTVSSGIKVTSGGLLVSFYSRYLYIKFRRPRIVNCFLMHGVLCAYVFSFRMEVQL